MGNAMNIYKRKDGRLEGRIPLGYDHNGKIKYRYLYSKSLSVRKEKMLCAYANAESSVQNACNRTFKELCCEWLSSAKLRVKQSSYSCYEKLINKHILPYFEDTMHSELNTLIINFFVEHKLKYGRINGFDAKTVSELLGHSNVNITLDRYVHSSMEMKKKCVDRLNLVT